jgi:hypothetical protein
MRRFVDSDFCSAEHRIESRILLNSGLADADPADEPWPVAARLQRRKSSSSTESVIVLAILAVSALSALGYFHRSTPAAPAQAPGPKTAGWVRSWGHSVTRIVPGASVRLVDDFRSGLSDWTADGGGRRGGGSWSLTADGLKPGRLRIWQKSRDLSDYQFHFQARIDRRGLGWAFRALDVSNCYAVKLSMNRKKTTLTHLVKLGGLEFDRVAEPLAVNIRRGEFCRVRVSVRADHFITFINDEPVASWTDRRLARGGVGFFTEEGESATVRSVTLTEQDSFMGRVLAYFSLVRMPLLEP